MCSKDLQTESLDLKMLDVVLEALDEKKAERVQVLAGTDSLLVDYFVVCEGTSRPHLKTLAVYVKQKVREAGYTLHHWEGYPDSDWMLLDFGMIVVHLFEPRIREKYGLEVLWKSIDLSTLRESSSQAKEL